MKSFVCKVCGLISIAGAPTENCPVCASPKTSFEEKEGAIKEPPDPNNLSELEKKHVPVIHLVKKCGLIPEGCQDVQVKMGETQHPMLPEHYIVHIDFYSDKKFISRVILTPEKLNPAAALHLKAQSGKLTVIEFCNVHGAWVNEIDL